MPSKKTRPTAVDLQQVKQSGGYIRVSTTEQEDDSFSLDRQKSAVEAAGATVIFKDVDSGSKDDRKALQELLRRVRAGEIDEVIVSRIDRFTRSLRQLLDLISEFETLKVNLRILDMNIDLRTPMGKFMVTLVGMFAEWETDQLSERLKGEQRQKRQNGVASNFCPFGYMVVQGKYSLNHQPFLCLLSDRPENYPTGELATTEEPVSGRTLYRLCREVVELFLEEALLRTTLGQFFEKYGVAKPRYRSNGSGQRMFWSLTGFARWLTNPVLQGHTSYLKQITVKKRQREMNPNGPEIHYGTHPEQRLISPEEAQEISAILKMNTRLNGGNFQRARNKRNQHSEFAYQTGLILCAKCGSRCTSKTANSGKYAYFACRNAGVGCGNKTSVRKSAIEQALILHLVAKSEEMREAAWEVKREFVGGVATILHASGADDQTVRQFLLSETAHYEDLEKPSSFSLEQTARITGLEEQLQDLEKMRHYNLEVERLKQQLRDEIEESKNASQSLLEKSAGEIIFEGNTSYFWDGLTHEDKTRVFDKIVRKIFIDQGKVTEVLLQHEQS